MMTPLIKKTLKRKYENKPFGEVVSIKRASSIFITLLFLVFFMSFFSENCLAVSIGVSPGSVNFDDVLINGYAEEIVTVSTNSPDEVIAGYKIEGPIEEWITFEPNESKFSMSASNPHKLKIMVAPPPDITTGTYTGRISFITDKFGDVEGRAGGVVRAAVTMGVVLGVVNFEIPECNAGALRINDIEEGGPLEIEAVIINEGNIRLRPVISVDIWDQAQENLLVTDELTVSQQIFPTQEVTIVERTTSKNLEIGQYWARVAIEECNAESMVTFSVVKQGSIIDKGLLREVSSKQWSFVNETVRINAIFENTGPRAVLSQFKGDIKLNNKIVEVIQTDRIDVPSGETAELFTYFTPSMPGRYVVSGRVHYNDKLTFEKGTIINVNIQDAAPIRKQNGILPLLLYLLIIITIIFILRKIIKKKKKKQQGYRRKKPRKIW